MCLGAGPIARQQRQRRLLGIQAQFRGIGWSYLEAAQDQDGNARFVAVREQYPGRSFLNTKPEERPMSKDAPKDDPREVRSRVLSTDGQAMEGQPEKEQRDDDAKINLEKWRGPKRIECEFGDT
jgi:hypothetical protein